ncbi:MAG: hypothetical protein ACXV5L_02515 [Thermoanaerobaculia bacterium]
MPKNQIERTTEVSSGFFERRRLRRIRMIVELTLNLISSDMTVSYREARSLVACARKAILDLHPSFEQCYERVVRPHFERILCSRWPGEESLHNSAVTELVN